MSQPVITRFDKIKNLAVFKDFKWDLYTKDKNRNILGFARVNIIYGRNYSGKTTLSRIVRALETGFLSDKYINPEFEVLFEGGLKVDQNTLKGHNFLIRVFNEDFVKENLRFVFDENQGVNSFAILGENNTKIEDEIRLLEMELGSDLEGRGLMYELSQHEKVLVSAKENHALVSESLDKRLRDKANKNESGIKHNKIFGNANYNIEKIKSDIDFIVNHKSNQLNENEIHDLCETLKDHKKDMISDKSTFNFSYDSLSLEARGLIERKIKISQPIQELLNNNLLEKWVREGKLYHQDTRKNCTFCGNPISNDVWIKLDNHFNKESEGLRGEIIGLISRMKSEISRIPLLINLNLTNFYARFHYDFNIIKEGFEEFSANYIASLKLLIDQLESRLESIATPLSFQDPFSYEDKIKELIHQYHDLIARSNGFTEHLSAEQRLAKDKLRLNEVAVFMERIDYAGEQEKIQSLKVKFREAQKLKDNMVEAINLKKRKIDLLKSQLKDETKGVDIVNKYLGHYFGHQSISLKALKDDAKILSSAYKFEIMRDDQKAYHLSEGECSLIAFCYFMAKLEDVNTRYTQPIVWIDDPISSLDSNHIFFVYSLIRSKFFSKEEVKISGKTVEQCKFSQLFISTHNLDFLKYLKRLPKVASDYRLAHFVVNRLYENSVLLEMPDHMREYRTEFNFLFHQIFKCAHIDENSNDEQEFFYNFGNNARKFLELLMYYKYPCNEKDEDKYLRFFGQDSVSYHLIDRINNEYSHLQSPLERGVIPIDVSEMKKAAKFILDKVLENDPDQYKALLLSCSSSNLI